MDEACRQECIWLTEAPQTDYPWLEGTVSADVAVVGGGIAGLMTGLLLQRAGMSVLVVEAQRVGCGVTGRSTAKVTSLHGASYDKIENNFDADRACGYAHANQAGLAKIAELAEQFQTAGIDCQFQRQPAFTYTCDPERVDKIRDEAEAARRAGLPASFTTESELPFDIAAAVRVEDQAQFHPYWFCVGLARALVEAGGKILETTRVHDVTVDDKEEVCRVQAHGSEIQVRHVVLATLLPILDYGGFFAKTHPSRSYAIAASLGSQPPTGMYINLESPTRSIRPLTDRQGIIVVGEQHKVGQDPDNCRRYEELISWTRQRFDVRSIDYRWSAQDYISVDSLPYIGRFPLGSGRVWTATGFNKWGLTTAAAGAMLLTDLIQGRESPWAELFDSTRADILPSAKNFIAENLDVAKRFVGDRLRALRAEKLSELPTGEGRIVNHDGDKMAAYRDESGVIYACSPVCTHLGCFVQWNAAEKSWDCPCHGSRFHYTGDVLQGPAVHPLESIPLPEST